MRHEEILRSNMNLHPDIADELGYAVCERGVRRALLVKSEQGFLPLTPSVIMNSNEEVEIEWYALDEAVEIYDNEFASIPHHLRSPGLMSDKFHQEISLPEVKFEPIY